MIKNFTLIISLRMIDNKYVSLDYLNLVDLSSEFQDNVQVSICYYISRSFKIAFNMLKKQLCKLNHSRSFAGRNKQHVLCNTIYNCKYAIKFLTVSHENR